MVFGVPTNYVFSLFQPLGSCKLFRFEYYSSNSNSKNGASRHHYWAVARRIFKSLKFLVKLCFRKRSQKGRSFRGKPTLAKSRHLRLAALVDFVKDRVSHWCEAHEESPNYGNFLDFDTFNLYQANFWVIEPATGDHGRKGCSYVELVAISMDDQRPKWFVSHAWLEPIVRFMLCLKRHALLRQLSLQSAYWVCASTWSNLPEKFCFTLVLVVLVVAHFWNAAYFWRRRIEYSDQLVEHVRQVHL